MNHLSVTGTINHIKPDGTIILSSRCGRNDVQLLILADPALIPQGPNVTIQGHVVNQRIPTKSGWRMRQALIADTIEPTKPLISSIYGLPGTIPPDPSVMVALSCQIRSIEEEENYIRIIGLIDYDHPIREPSTIRLSIKSDQGRQLRVGDTIHTVCGISTSTVTKGNYTRQSLLIRDFAKEELS